MQYSVIELGNIVNGTIFGASTNHVVTHIETDTRKLLHSTDCCFVALKGPHYDGQKFVQEAYQNGVRVFMTDTNLSKKYNDCIFIVVKDTLKALQKLAAFHRRQFELPVIGITGSNGKTIIKEWLYQLIHGDLQVCRSPKSYNSQVGVPLSVLQLQKGDELGIFEAGISKPMEMANLAEIINPTLGIFTNIGPAHDAGFASIDEKVNEKLLLFENCETIIYCKDHQIIDAYLRENIKCISWGQDEDADYVVKIHPNKNLNSVVEIFYCEKNYAVEIPFSDKAYIENCLHCIITLLHLGYDIEVQKDRLLHLRILPMRMELKHGINNCTLIDDSYSADILSLQVALDFFRQQETNQKKTLIISAFEDSGITDTLFIKKIIQIIRDFHFDKIIGVGPAFMKSTAEFFKLNIEFHSYPSTESLLQNFRSIRFDHELILLKGARNYQFERISYELLGQTHKTILEINLNALIDNLNTFKTLLNPNTGIIPMVKAFSYGSGSSEIATLLEEHNVPYLAVAYVDEGVRLRERGITIPIMVLNPDVYDYPKMIEHHLEPEIYTIEMLQQLINWLEKEQYNYKLPIHLKIETGMNRLGIVEEDHKQVASILKHQNCLMVKTIFSHLAAADELSMDDFTLEQIDKFEKYSTYFINELDYPIKRHLLNSSGIVRFKDAQYDYVRLGIGLYGVEGSGVFQHNLLPVGTLKTRIAQIKKVKSGDTVGYSRKGKTKRDTIIAIIAIGYADGYDRRFSNGVGHVYVRGHKVPVLGNVCMDMTMIDVTDIIDIQIGDEVEIFGRNISIIDAAKAIGTIAYELLTGISPRVKRVYHYE